MLRRSGEYRGMTTLCRSELTSSHSSGYFSMFMLVSRPVDHGTCRVYLVDPIGIGSGAGWTVGNITGQIGLSCALSTAMLGDFLIDINFVALLQIGLAYAFGILFAIGVCGSTSGGHFNPCMTVCFVIFKGFPPLKGLRCVLSSLSGIIINSSALCVATLPRSC